MLKTERASVMNFENAMRGARNPMNSWDRLDSRTEPDGTFVFGPNDLNLAKRLRKAGSDHRKFLRQVFVSVDITAPLYWWKEFDTYKVGTVANSTSTMHKIASAPITMDNFSHDHLTPDAEKVMEAYVTEIEKIRLRYLTDGKNKDDWYDLIEMIPESWEQMRTVTLNYENLIGIYNSRKDHKLTEWHQFCDFIRHLPYAEELIISEE